MKVMLTGGRVAAPADIRTLESSSGIALEPEYRDFISQHDGATPDANIFVVAENNNAGITRFIPVDKIREEMSFIEELPHRWFPVAWAEGGDYVLIASDEAGGVWYWDNEIEGGFTRLADNFGAFLESLEPFDPNNVEPPQGHVVWFDPEFVKNVKRSQGDTDV